MLDVRAALGDVLHPLDRRHIDAGIRFAHVLVHSNGLSADHGQAAILGSQLPSSSTSIFGDGEFLGFLAMSTAGAGSIGVDQLVSEDFQTTLRFHRTRVVFQVGVDVRPPPEGAPFASGPTAAVRAVQ